MMRVLIADDQTLVRQGIRGLLELTGQVTVVGEAEDGDQALRRIRELRPDVALLDVRMPGKSGVEVVRTLRSEGFVTPVLLLTTFDDDDALMAGIREGIAGYLLKDVAVEELVSALRIAADGGSLILPKVAARALASAKTQTNHFEAAESPDRLTPREIEVLRLIARGASNREIARAFGTAEGTVKNQASSILSKLGVRDRTRAVLKALELQLLE